MRYFTSIILLFFTLNLAAQQRCSSDEFLLRYLESHPEEMQKIQDARKAAINSAVNKEAQAVIDVPIVVHVVYNTSRQNISDAQIFSQLKVLNEDFRKKNADANKVPSAFAGLSADTEINFCLASRDPLGFKTSGIIRQQTSVTEWNESNSDQMKNNSTGGSSPWNRDQYLNIWVCNLSPNLLGYAYPPGASPSVDGVVIDYEAFGTTGTASAPYNLGRTTTHEIGHWLGLRHLWGSNNGCESDNVNDTPLQEGPNSNCPNFPSPSTCNGVSNGPNGDMFMNYMDYVLDRCMHMFSAGQKSLMQGVLNTSRSTIKNSFGCGFIGIRDQQKTTVDIYPNPANTMVNLIFQHEGQKRITVLDLTGRVVLNKQTYKQQEQISIEHLPQGSYLIQIEDEEQITTQLLIVE